jgi:hypothetical protein
MTNIKKNCDIQSKALLSRPLVLHICCCATDILSALVAKYQSKLCYTTRLFSIFVACATDILSALVARNSKQALISHSLVSIFATINFKFYGKRDRNE